MIEVVVTTGATGRAKLHSNCHNQQTNSQFSTRATLCVSAVFDVVRCLVCPSVTLVDCIHTAEGIVKPEKNIAAT